MPDETIDDFHRAGLFRALQPARAGGAELHPADFFDICAEVAQGCASSAWVLSNLAYHHQFLALWPDRAQQEVWGPSPTRWSAPRTSSRAARRARSTAATSSRASGRSRAASIPAAGACSAPWPATRPTSRRGRATSCCRARTTRCSTPGTWWACAPPAARTSPSARPSCRATAACPSTRSPPRGHRAWPCTRRRCSA
ncbi:hypothetical protein [Variovorax sp. UC122_21]|uniref:hypothetical protein n=1 Tax=Variovorax sp. UC122_21 TaxID=3374554 RepID=UPI0037562D5F